MAHSRGEGAAAWIGTLVVFAAVVAAACSGSTSDGPLGSGGASGSGAAAGGGGGTQDPDTGAGGTASGGNAGVAGGPDSSVDSGGPCGPSPSGCSQTGCPEGQQCDQTQGCRPAACSCNADTGQWGCTTDCNGGTCVAPECVGCPLEMPERDSSCANYPEGKRCNYAQQTGRCEYFTGGTSSGRNVVTCRSIGGNLVWN